MNIHQYELSVVWTGQNGLGTVDYASYKRDYTIQIKGKSEILASADSAFRGDSSKMNPEDMLLSAVASCHMLWFLHECADHGIVVLDYVDNAKGIMEEEKGKGGRFTEVILQPLVLIEKSGDLELSKRLHETASLKCFISNSCNFPIRIECRHAYK